MKNKNQHNQNQEFRIFSRKKTSKKAQIQAQIFVYVLSMIVIGLVLLYGYKSIGKMRERAKQVDLIGFKTDVRNAVEKVSNDYGTVRAPEFKVPEGYDEVCFIDLDKGADPSIESLHPLVYEAWQDDSANVFLIKDLAKEFYLVESNGQHLIQIDSPGYICPEVKGSKVKVRLEGVGGKAKLSEIE